MLAYKDKNSRWHDWHLGESIPQALAHERVVTVQLDGHELDMLFAAMESAFIGPGGRVLVNRQLAEPAWDGKEV